MDVRDLNLEAIDYPRSLHDWHEDLGPCLWWAFPIVEPPWVGTPLDYEWPGYHTHWTPIRLPREYWRYTEAEGVAENSTDTELAAERGYEGDV